MQVATGAGARARALFSGRLPAVLAIGEAGIAEPRADCQHTPVIDILHERQLTQALHHRIVVHDHDGVMIPDARNGLAQQLRQVEALVLPVAGQVLAAAID